MPDDVSMCMKQTGMTLVSTVGGAAGPLYGTAFMKAGDAIKGKEEVHVEDAIVMMDAAIQGVMRLGKATTGEKTMLDSLVPAYEALKVCLEDGKDAKTCFAEAVVAAEEGVEYTKTIIATKGRASYLGERSIGHQDPGATSSLVILTVIRDFLA
jgi:dihydroxyacetone kinase-like protein